MDNRYWSVSETVNRVKTLLEAELRSLQLVGEVSNLSSSASGHWYFTLSDQNASISAALFKGDALRNSYIKKLKNGDKILCSGGIGVYTKRGTFQLIVKNLLPYGEGELGLKLEALKKKLASEGLFDPAKKQAIPKYPKRIGVITALKAAALQDFINIYKRRGIWVELIISPALVQGIEAPASLRKAFFKLLKYHLGAPADKKIDVIVLTRGGGSIEDLWAFNDEALAWDIHNSPVPVISAVGHEVDFSISDYVADFRCETPSAAAEVLTAAQVELKNHMQQVQKQLYRFAEIFSLRHRDKLEGCHPQAILQRIYGELMAKQRMFSKLEVKERLIKFSDLHEKHLELDDMLSRLHEACFKFIELKNLKVEQLGIKVEALDPTSVLKRGYSFLKDPSGAIIESQQKFDNLIKGDKLKVVFHDGVGVVTKD